MSAIAKPEIPQAPRREILHFNWGNTDQIMTVIMAVANKEHLGKQVEKLSETFRATPGQQYDKLGELWAYVRSNIPYVPDAAGVQQIKHPARTWEDAERGEGSDCKSMSVFVRFVLYNLGIPHFLRFASYIPSKRIQHVYVVALLDGEEVILDTVYNRFDEEVEYTWKQDKKPERMTKIVEIAGLPENIQLPERPWFPIASMTDGELSLALSVRELELVTAINKGRGFNTQAEEQERALEYLSGVLQKGLSRADARKAPGRLQEQIRKLQQRDYPSYEAFGRDMIAIAGEFDPTPAQRALCRQYAEQKAREITQYGQALPEGIQLSYPYSVPELIARLADMCIDEKKMENVVNAHLVDAGVNFLYDQMGEDGNFNSIISTKLLNQKDWIFEAARVTGLSVNNVRAITRTGTIEKIGETPESAKTILYSVMTKNPAGIGDPLTISAIVGLIGAIVSFIGAGIALIRQFQQQDEFQQAFRNIKDPGSPVFAIGQNDFAIPVDEQGNPVTPPGGPVVPGQPGGEQGNNLLTLGLLGAGALLFLK